MNTFVFSSKEELLSQAEKDEACQKGLDWAKEKDSLESILKEIPLDYRIWCLEKGYSQFLNDCPWEQLKGFIWTYLLSKQPQFSKYCSYWDKLDGEDWSNLLSKQPQLSSFCSFWEKLDRWDWLRLLSSQPQFSKFCSWNKLNILDWINLFFKKYQFAKFRK